ncbi:MAG: diaminopimelate epimerase [Selenomonadaceae bacterium]
MKLKFTKWQGCGNDFVLVNDMDETIKDKAALAKEICDRHYGVGADGLILMLPSKKADLCMRIFNTDGSEAEMCGNGIRCFARLAYEEGIVKSDEFTIETGAGILVPRIVQEGGRISGVCVDMGEPHLVAKDIPVTAFAGKGDDDRIVNEPMTVGGKDFHVTCVSMGNPHCVVFLDDDGYDMSTFPIKEIGPKFEMDPHFPRKTNTEFIHVVDRSHVRMRVWERGAAVTLACGTGACATTVACVLSDKTERAVDIELDGGKLHVEWGADNHAYMTGPAVKVFEGIYENEK